MTLVLIKPGNRTPHLNLQKVLNERHDEIRAAQARRNDARKANGATPAVDFASLAETAQCIGVSASKKDAKDAAGFVRKAARLLETLSADLGDYKPIEGLESVDVAFIALRDADREDLAAAVMVAEMDVETAAAVEDKRVKITAEVSANKALVAAKGALITRAVAWLRVGGEEFTVIDDAVVDAVVATGGDVFEALFVAARDYQGLSPGKSMRFGVLPQQT